MTSSIDKGKKKQTRVLRWDMYPAETPIRVVQFFERQLNRIHRDGVSRERVQIHYGDRHTGRAYELDDTGYIALTDSDPPGFLLLFNRASNDGPEINLEQIIKIIPTKATDNDGKPYYRHPLFHVPRKDVSTPRADADDRLSRRIVFRRDRK
jgi:hypothetical protein